jgi:hypothetical protein
MIALRCAAVVLVGLPFVASAMNETRAHRGEAERLHALTQKLAPLAARHAGARRLIVNGSPIVFGTKTSKTDVARSLDTVRDECQSGDRAAMLALPAETSERPSSGPAPELRRIDREQDGAEAGAVLCVFGDAKSDGHSPQIRFSLARRVDAKTTSVFTIATETEASLETLYPLEGDAPGHDLPGVPRPLASRRDFSATFEGEAYGVWIYEAPGAMTDVVARYDVQMAAAGWKRSASVAEAFPDARAYTRDGLELVVSFEAREGATFVSLAPLDRSAP